MNESIIVGLVVGAGVAVIGALVSYYLRRWEMRDLWAEEERRRKTEHKREIRERDLRIIGDSLYAAMEAVDRLGAWAWLYAEEGWESRVKLALREVGPESFFRGVFTGGLRLAGEISGSHGRFPRLV